MCVGSLSSRVNSGCNAAAAGAQAGAQAGPQLGEAAQLQARPQLCKSVALRLGGPGQWVPRCPPRTCARLGALTLCALLCPALCRCARLHGPHAASRRDAPRLVVLRPGVARSLRVQRLRRHGRQISLVAAQRAAQEPLLRSGVLTVDPSHNHDPFRAPKRRAGARTGDPRRTPLLPRRIVTFRRFSHTEATAIARPTGALPPGIQSRRAADTRSGRLDTPTATGRSS